MEYQKIPGPFNRHVTGPDKNKLIIGDWTSPELKYLADTEWNWTEKVDGTNIRIMWDGHKVTYGGRTDNAQIPAKLIEALDGLVTEELFEQTFGESRAILYGEGYGAGIQSGGKYRPDMSFVLFDARIGDWWLTRQGVVDVATKMGLHVVPLVATGNIWMAIDMVKAGLKSSWNPDLEAEGLVGVTVPGLRARNGKRIIVKIKGKDFR